MRIWLMAAGATVAAGCTVQLGTVRAPPGVTESDLHADVALCRDRARLAVDKRAGPDLLLGLTVIGAPLAMAADVDTERAEFATCMRAKNYEVTPPGAARVGPKPPLDLPIPARPVSGSFVATATLDLPAGFEPRPLSDAERRAHVVAVSINRSVNVAVSLAVEHRAGNDVLSYVQQRRPAQMSVLANATSSEVGVAEVGGRRVYRYDLDGTLNGTGVAMFVTVIDASPQLVTVTTWTAADNRAKQESLMRAMPDRVAGLGGAE